MTEARSVDGADSTDGAGDGGRRASPRRGSGAMLAVIAGVAVVTGSFGWWLGRGIRSPEQLEAEAAPPPPSVITAEVEMRPLRDILVTRGVVSPAEERAVSVFGAGGEIVTRLVLGAGEMLSEGDLLLELGGRPVLSIEGETPVFRDLVEGAVGADVRQLEEAFVRLGLLDVADEIFDDATSRAVIGFYRGAGYEPLPVDHAARAAWHLAAAKVRRAEELVMSAKGAGPEAVARLELMAARRAMDDIEAETALMIPAGELVSIPGLPLLVIEDLSTLGEPVAGAVVRLARGPLQIVGRLTEAQRSLVEVGDRADVIVGPFAEPFAGVIVEVATLPDPDAPGGAMYRVVVEPEALEEALTIGADLQLNIIVEGSDEESLVVPVTAIHTDGTGELFVVRVTASGVEERVDVTTGRSAGGLVQIVPHSPLQPGELVRVGAP